MRRVCEDAPFLDPISDGASLRNFDKKLHAKTKYRCEKTLTIKRDPYLRQFTLSEEHGKDKSDRSEVKGTEIAKVKEPWRKRPRAKKSSKNEKNDIGTFQLGSGHDHGQISKDHRDIKWNFGVRI